MAFKGIQHIKFIREIKTGSKIKIYMPEGVKPIYGIAKETVVRPSKFKTKETTELLIVKVSSKEYTLEECDRCLEYKLCLIV